MEALVDLTPYSPLLEAAAASGEEISFYSHIDTWVGNTTGRTVLHVGHDGETCSSTYVPPDTDTEHGDGNGWDVSADLVFWPLDEELKESFQPHTSITLASGNWGQYSLGEIGVHEAVVADDGASIDLKHPERFHAQFVEDTVVFPCPGGAADVADGVKLHHTASMTGYFDARPLGKDALKGMFVEQATQRMSPLRILTVDLEAQTARAAVGASVQPRSGMAVYLAGGREGVETERFDNISRKWQNTSYPFEPVGKVMRAKHKEVVIFMNSACLLKAAQAGEVNLQVPHSVDVIPRVAGVERALEQLMLASRTAGSDGDLARRPGGSARSASQALRLPWVPPLLMQQGSQLVLARPLARLDLQAIRALANWSLMASTTSWSAPQVSLLSIPAGADAHALSTKAAVAGAHAAPGSLQPGQQVCVVARHRQGKLFERQFEAPSLAEGERVILQLAATGHGWSQSTEQCGEFCQASYRVELNGKTVTNVTLWRDDCQQNPLDDQFGTWPDARNGWCPGSVEPGLFIDITDALRVAAPSGGEGQMQVRAVVYVAVRSSASDLYEPYSDDDSFPGLGGDSASIFMGMTLFVYSADSVAAILSLPQGRTAAEKAIREGTSDKSAMLFPRYPGVQLRDGTGGNGVLDFESLQQEADVSGAGDQQGDGGFDTERRAPWYMYDSAAEGPPGAAQGARSVPVFTGKLIQMGRALVIETLPAAKVPQAWSRVALRLQLSQPPELQIDHWDRFGSIGMLFSRNATSRSSSSSSSDSKMSTASSSPQSSGLWLFPAQNKLE